MKHYNRALDYTVLALTELKAGNGVLAARLMSKAVAQTDITAAIATLEASNKHAYALKALAKKRLKAGDEFPFTDEGEDDYMEEAGVEDEDFGESDDPLSEVDDEGMGDEAPGEAMAKVLSSMVRKAGRK